MSGRLKVKRGEATLKAARPGDVASSLIERHVLSQAEAHAPGIVAAVRRCGGCTQAKHALGSAEPHPDPGVVL